MTTATPATPASQPASGATPHALPRYYFLDWVRILAFFLLIAYHVGMYYVSWGWHIKSPDAGAALEPYMMLSSPWRLSLLFLVAGVASGCMLARLPPRVFLRERSWRLLVPLLFGMLVIVPPQSYCEVVEKVGYSGSYLDFMRLYLRAYHGFCDKDGCLLLPTWNHLWFVAYLWAYTMVLALAVLACRGRLVARFGARFGMRFNALAQAAGRLLTGWKIVVLPAAVLAVARMLMRERFPDTHALVDDWYAHASYFSVFLLGALLARVPAFWPRVETLRWHALGLALAGWALMVIWNALPDTVAGAMPWAVLIHPMRAVVALTSWTAIVAACGFARRHLDRDGPARRYLTQAVFPVYILHQTLIVLLAHALKPLHRPPGLEALLLVVLTTVLCFTGFELVRRVALLRPLFGLGALQRPMRVAPALAAGRTGP
jgi:glucan biosynthesis protein C